MKKRDLFIVLFTLIVAGTAFLITFGGSETVKVYSDGQLWGELPLSKNAVYDINGTNTLTIKDGKAYMSYATCPDKLCILQGEIDSAGGAIVCLPNRISAEVGALADAVSR